MKQVFDKTFGGLKKEYLFRQYFFGSVISALMLWGFSSTPDGMSLPIILMVALNTLLYPYSRYVYESVVGFIFGDNVFFVNAILMILVKVFTMGLCWSFSIVIAPIGLGYLYLYHTRTQTH